MPAEPESKNSSQAAEQPEGSNGILSTLGHSAVDNDDETMIVSAGPNGSDGNMLELFETKHRNEISMILSEERIREIKR